MHTYVIFASWFEPKDSQQTENPNIGSFDCYNALSFAELKHKVDLLDPEIVGKTVSAGRIPDHSMYEQWVEVLHIFHHEGNPTPYIKDWFASLEHPKKDEFSDMSLYEHWQRVPNFPSLYAARVPK